MILASQSPRRIELLGSAGLDFKVIPADIDESRREGESPVELVERLACEKAAAVLDRAETNELVIAADTIVWMGDEALGKPADEAGARAMLRELSGRSHHVSTGCCMMLRDLAGHVRSRSFVDTTEVRFYELSDEEIAAYVAGGEPMDKAGAYGIQGQGRFLVRSIDGNYDNVVGLPVARLVRACRSFVRSL